MGRQQVTVRMPPKAVFDFLCDPTIWEEFTKWRVRDSSPVEPGTQWTERRLWRKRTWHVTAHDRRGLFFTARSGDLQVEYRCKKGGTASCNIQMHIDGPEHAVARFEKEGRLERLRVWLDGE